ncbi:unnamed protein product [Blepharisma stoltei]|uniref:Uncharacterized protein n=1 Tax=Blepharisma stoltei TaxID=1481888 RepID=A0AAU9IJP5_9CILI|nr:unnamed protein product [Blepharisma stoltei]
MVPAQIKILIKLLLDLTFFFLVFSIYLINSFRFMKTNHIGMTELSVKSRIDGVYEIGAFKAFENHWCPNLGSIDAICDNINDWKKAGVLFIVFTSFAHVFMVFGMVNLILKSCFCCFKLRIMKDLENYIYPLLYSLSLILYVTVSKVFTLEKPMYYSDAYNVKAESGLVLMFVALSFSLVSGGYYFYFRREINGYCEVAGKESFLMRNVEKV